MSPARTDQYSLCEVMLGEVYLISCASYHRCHEIWTSSAVTGKQHSSPSSCLYHRATLNYRCLHHSFDQADQNSRSDTRSSHGVRRIIIMVITMIKIRVLIIIILMIMRIDGEVQPWCRTNAILEIRSPAQITSGASQVPRPTCFWKWVGATVCLFRGNFTLRHSSGEICA